MFLKKRFLAFFYFSSGLCLKMFWQKRTKQEDLQNINQNNKILAKARIQHFKETLEHYENYLHEPIFFL